MFPLSTTDRSMAITIQSSNPIINHQITITMRVLALVATLVGLSSISASMDRHFPRSSLPAHWSALNVKVEPTQRLQLRVALFPKNAQALENTLLGVATPGSKSFRQYLKKEEITSIVGRAEDELSALKTFFAAHGMQLTSVHPHKDWIFVEGSVAAIEALFKCQLGHFQHRERSEDTRIGKILTH
jgi:subtilase family serine protease